MQLVDNERHDQCNHHRRNRDLILAQRLLLVEAEQNHKPYGKEHTHIVDDQPGGTLVNIFVNHKDTT